MKREELLMERCRQGDDSAFSLLVEDMLGIAYNTSFQIVRSKEHAEDSVQNALVEAYVSIMKGSQITNFKAWFYRLVYSRSIDLYRKNKRNSENYNIINLEERITSIEASPQDQVIKEENKSEVFSYISSLNEEQSVPILLHYYEGMSIREIALVINEKENTVKSRLKRGREKLGRLMNDGKKFNMEVRAYGI